MKNKIEFSKLLLLQESALVWIITIALVVLAFLSINQQYIGDLPWLAALVGAVWAAYGVSQAFYYNKAKKENMQGGIKYMTVANSLGLTDCHNKAVNQEELDNLFENADG